MSNTPNIRFKGFTAPWEQRKLSSLCEIITVGIANSATHAYTDDGIVMFRNQNIKENYLDDSDVIYIDKDFEKKYSNKRLKVNDLLVARTGYPGTACVVPEKYEGAQTFTTLIARLKEGTNPFYACQYINSDYGKKYFLATQIGGGQKNSGAGILEEFPMILSPTVAEQNRIADYFSSIDNLITLHQRKCDEMLESKKFMLQKVFPKNGERFPEIRFSGFTVPWEQRKFGELYQKVSLKNNMTYGLEDIISVANMYYKPDTSVKSEEYLKTYNVFELGDIAFEGNKSKNFAHGRFVENTIGNGIVSHVFDVFKPITEYDLSFWKHYINCEGVMGPIMTRVTKSSTMMTNLVAKDFLNESIRVPSIDEQKKIGRYLDSLDDLTNLHQRKCEELKEFKKFMLHNMFPTKG